MTDALLELRRQFVERYDALKRQLTYRLGSSELAGDALHDTYVKLAAKEGLGPQVRSPHTYLLRIAVNLAIDRIRADGRLLSTEEVDDLLAPDELAGDPADAAAARIDLERVALLLERLPARRRQVFLAARVEGLAQPEIAKRHGISLRLVELEIRRAHDFCVEQMRKETK